MSLKRSHACCCGLCMRVTLGPCPAPRWLLPRSLTLRFMRGNASTRSPNAKQVLHAPPPGEHVTQGGDAVPPELLCERCLPSRCVEARIICRVDPNDLVRKHNISHHGRDRCDRVYLCLTQHAGDVVRFCCFAHRVTRCWVPRDVRACESQGKSLSLVDDFLSGTAWAARGVE